MTLVSARSFDEIFYAIFGDTPPWKIHLWCDSMRAIWLLREFAVRSFQEGKFDQGRRLIRMVNLIGRKQDDLLLESNTVH